MTYKTLHINPSLASFPILSTAVLFAFLQTLAIPNDEAVNSLVVRLTSGDDNTRLAARLDAAKIGAPAVEALGRLMTYGEANVRIAARAALELVVNHAGRPGGVEERGEVCAQLVNLVENGTSPVVQESLYLLGLIAGDRSVPAIARRLDDADEHVREAARQSLERVPGMASSEALIAATKRADAAIKPRLLYSLSKKGLPSVIPILEEYAKAAKTPEIRLSALEGLARLGVKSASPLFDEALASPQGIDIAALQRTYLLLADVLNEHVDRSSAIEIFQSVFETATESYLREHAVLGLCPPGSDEYLDTLIVALADPAKRVRRLARRHLALLEGPAVTLKLMAAYAGAKASARPALLRTLADRDREAARALIKGAATGSDLVLRVTALDILGDLDQPELEQSYLELSERGLDVVRPVAVRGYLAIAHGDISRGNKEKAAAMFLRVLEALPGASIAARIAAIDGLAQSGDQGSLEVLTRSLSDSMLANDAARGIVKLALVHGKAGDTQVVAGYLRRILESQLPQELITSGVEALKELGLDPQAPLKSEGFVLDWMLTTPILDPDGKGFEFVHFPEKLLAKDQDMGFAEIHNIGPRRVRWRQLDRLSKDGSVNLRPFFRRTENVLVYGYVEFESDADREVLLKVGSDDGVACWLNKKKILAKAPPRSFRIDENVVPAKFRKGKNILLIKVTQRDSDWAFSVRVTDRNGAPIDTAGLVGVQK